jgi:hypothetical protein
MKVTGACHCGAISYEAEVDPDRVVICHCTDCQTISGAPYRVNVPVRISYFQLTGTPKPYRKIGDSGMEIVTNFCGECGTALFSCRAEAPTHVNLRVGSTDQRAELAPKAQGFCGSAMPWSADITNVPQITAAAPAATEDRPA